MEKHFFDNRIRKPNFDIRLDQVQYGHKNKLLTNYENSIHLEKLMIKTTTKTYLSCVKLQLLTFSYEFHSHGWFDCLQGLPHSKTSTEQVLP